MSLAVQTYTSATDNLLYGDFPIVTRSVEIAASQTLKRGTVVSRAAAKFSLEVADASGGTLTLSALGKTTATIAYNAAAATIKTALEAQFGAGNVDATGGALGTNPVVITFKGALAGAANADLTVDGSELTGEGAAATVTEDAGSRKVTKLTAIPAADTPLFVMAEPVVTEANETAVATAYETGHFNSRAIDIDEVVGNAIIEHLRTKGIHLSESVPA